MSDKTFPLGRLVILDYNDTLVNTPFIDHKPLHILPGVQKVLNMVKQQDPTTTLAVAMNAGGVARGYSTEVATRREVENILAPLHIDIIEISYGYPWPKAGYERYNTPEMLEDRKPNTGMIKRLMEACDATPRNTILVGDSEEEDRQTALKAGIPFVYASRFFSSLHMHFFDTGLPKE